MENSNITLFPYNEKDFYFNIRSKDEDSKFDTLLKKQWTRVEQDNLLRYSVAIHQSKLLEGKYGFYVQLNTKRATLRRKPEEFDSMLKPFDSNIFNFMKISDKEILFDIGNGDSNDVITVNVSPILWGHSLFLPERTNSLPQKVTLYSFRKVIEILLLSNSENLRVLFNSLCANASVNHLHWHFFYLDHRMLLEWIPLQYFLGSIYLLENFPAKGFCIKFSSFDQDINKYASYAYKVVSCLQENEIAHNICITRSKTKVEQDEFDDIRVYIWARLPNYGKKNTKDFNIAAAELFGYLPIKSQEVYETINEQYISECFNNITIDAFECAKKKIMEIV